ncbi:TPA: hypothetical protein HA241_01090 [Candidatus Woesearchaeota archaeon]|nr:hypothetical protein [Candidatus Woesearchaeota archaeon]
MEFRRKIYARGSSFETTLPKPLLFKLNVRKKNVAIFRYDVKQDRWYVDFEEERR